MIKQDLFDNSNNKPREENMKRHIDNFRLSTIARSLKLFSRRDKLKIARITVLQTFLGFLDLAGVAVVGILGALTVNGIQSKVVGDRLRRFLEFLNIQDFTFQKQAAILGIIAAVLLISKTIFSVLITRHTLFFLSKRSAQISSQLIFSLLSKSLLEVQEKTHQQILFSVTTGVTSVTVGVIGTIVTLISDNFLLIFLTFGLFVVDPTIAFSTVGLFAFVGFILYFLMQRRARELGTQNSSLSIKSNEKILEVLQTYRESVVHNRRHYYASLISMQRQQLARNTAEMSFQPMISKYVVESTLVFGTLMISALQFFTKDATQAIATLAIFLAAGTRIAPAVLRIQQGAITIKSSLGVADPTLRLFESYGISDVELYKATDEAFSHIGFVPGIDIKNLSFRYPGSERFAVENVTLQILPGESVAFVGPSGAGKTTLVDLLLGILDSEINEVRISGTSPLEAIEKYPGAISYVPQDIVIFDGTFRQNVSLGYPIEMASDKRVLEALSSAQLVDFVTSLRLGLDSEVGDRGTRISGGQRQRLGIARALFSKPQLLVLDEATSSLDGLTESEITRAIDSLRGTVTVLLIAHRLTTVMKCDKVVYMESGRVLHVGTFDEVRAKVRNFDLQVKQMDQHRT
jgi:ABC-type multidrug transport system fused ATPase/permease subunit